MANTDGELVEGVFRNLTVAPRHGDSTAALLWTVQPGWDSATFTIQKSADGINDWTKIGVVQGQRWFDDAQFKSLGRHDQPHYRVFARNKDGSKAWSPVVGAFAVLSRKEFGVASKIIKLEAVQLRTRSPALLLKLNPAAEPCPSCVDVTTGQRLTTSFCGRCFGTGKLSAYFASLPTFVWFRTATDRSKVAKEDGSGLVDEHVSKARMLAVPPLDREDMIVEPAMDRRWLVETIQVGLFNGKVPVTCDLTLRRLATTDARYRLPV